MKNARYYNYTEESEIYENSYDEEVYLNSICRGCMRNSYTSAFMGEGDSFDESCFYLDAKLFS